MERCTNVTYRLTAALASCQMSRIHTEVFKKKKAPSGSNSQLDKILNLAAGTEVVPWLERSPSSPAGGGCYRGKHQRRRFQMWEGQRTCCSEAFFYINLLETRVSGWTEVWDQHRLPSSSWFSNALGPVAVCGALGMTMAQWQGVSEEQSPGGSFHKNSSSSLPPCDLGH